MAIGVDPTESADQLKQFSRSNGYPWLVAAGTPALLEKFNVVSTSIKYGVNRQGIITHQAGYGVEDEATWQKVFERLVTT